MATNIFVYWSDGGLGGRAFDRHSRKGAGHLPTKIAHRAGLLTNFSNARGEGMLAAGIDPHINADVNSVFQEKLLILFLME